MIKKTHWNRLVPPGAVFAAVVFAALIAGSCIQKEVPADTTRAPSRIISLAPSITETLFALGLGDKVVGVTTYCRYPEQARAIDKVGAYMDPNFEAIVTLKPDLVILLKEHSSVQEFLRRKGTRFLAIDNHDIDAILESISLTGKACGKTAESCSLRDTMAAEIRAAYRTSKSMAQNRPGVLLCVGRDDVGTGTLSKIWAAGANTWYNQIISIAGGANVITDSSMEYVTLSSEAIIRLKPDIIIDVMASMSNYTQDMIKEDWADLFLVPAVKNRMIFCLAGDYITIPGPRLVWLLRDVKAILEEYYVRSNNRTVHAP